ncbi:diacylglycerol/lipid kinase family protein [Mesobacillus selenatarsenatis]|uniref:Transcription regulator [contains diacylglycerol kinase catalytic domain] n=1 Tax=Mesobacillus selenatarsenatis (strain DSM 18680 / JCM 14380 / FERM P-15431 / SF-1) TaxID=1321606 RepID=A0A0A8WZ43_MESS1|nr:diacylglycerol kinase family protein [Mesobacillus selenatarsenatis]GAM12985.1 transcription regulator [contains diacylglycerol kinase catalytic domain] [Mesobacillus selenatarsenatis SF-1]
MKAMIILNPSSGKEKAPDYAEKIEETLREKYDEIDIRKTEKEGDAAAFATEACIALYDAVIAMGGDGTINEAINGLAEQAHRPALGIIPLGTVNDFARALNIPLDPYAAISILDEQYLQPVDIGKINEHYFANVIAVGAIAEASYSVSPELKTRLGSLAYFMEGAKSFLNGEAIDISVEHDNGKWEGQTFLLLAALTNSVGGFDALAPEASVNDGKFHAFIIKKMSVPKIAALIPSLMKGELQESEEVEYIRTSFLKVTSDKQHVVNIDGEEGEPLPFNARVLPGHLDVFVPLKSEKN